MALTGLEGPGIGHQERPQLNPVSSLCIQLELIKPGCTALHSSVPLFDHGAFGRSAGPGPRPRLGAGAARGLRPSSLVLGQWPGTVP